MKQSNDKAKSVCGTKTLEEMISAAGEFFEYMNIRRSCTDFSNEPVPDEIINTIIKTAGTAPSGANKQPWKFCIVKNQRIKHQIREAAEKEEKRNYEERFSDTLKNDLKPLNTSFIKEFLDKAPVLIVLFKENYSLVGKGIIKPNYYVNESVSIALGFLIAAIHQAGLATLCYTPSPMDFLNGILGRPKNESPVAILPVGFAGKNYRCPKLPRKPMEEIIVKFD